MTNMLFIFKYLQPMVRQMLKNCANFGYFLSRLGGYMFKQGPTTPPPAGPVIPIR